MRLTLHRIGVVRSCLLIAAARYQAYAVGARSRSSDAVIPKGVSEGHEYRLHSSAVGKTNLEFRSGPAGSP